VSVVAARLFTGTLGAVAVEKSSREYSPARPLT